MMSLGVLALGTMGGISAFLLLNRYAANLRNMSVARALCQERIEQAQTLTFLAPTTALPTGTMPMAPNADAATKATVTTVAILGTASNWNAASSTYVGGSNLQTSTETIPVATQSENTTLSNAANVTYTRTTTISPAPLYYIAGSVQTTTSLNVLQFNVTVSYVFHGQTYSTFMNTLRGPN